MKRNKIAFSVMLGVFTLALVTAGIIYSVQRNVTVDASFIFNGDNSVDTSVSGGESVFSELLNVESQTSVNVPLSIETTTDPSTTEATHTNRHYLSVTGTQGNESRLTVTGEDSVMNLVDLNSVEWEVEDGVGYAPHVDVFLDNGETLVFEYAKVDPNQCDDLANYPTGDFNTFNDKGVVDDSAYAWLSSGPAGPCGDETFDENHKSLADWKTIYPNAKIVKFEFEVDNWMTDSDAKLSEILINGNSVEPTLLPGDYLNFDVETEFSINTTPKTYTITTEVTPRV